MAQITGGQRDVRHHPVLAAKPNVSGPRLCAAYALKPEATLQHGHRVAAEFNARP